MDPNYERGGVKKRYQVIEALRGMYSVQELCEVLGVSRSGYYRYLQRKKSPRDGKLRQTILAMFRQFKGIYGYRRIQMELERQYGWNVNHKRVLRVMQELGIQARIRKKYKYMASSRPSIAKVVDNVLNREFLAQKPNEKWVTDVSFIRVGSQWGYLSVILDLFNNEVLAYHFGLRNDNDLVLQTLKKARKKRKDATGVILHSDRGFQYTSRSYHDMLARFGWTPSMSRKGNCFDNACVESFFSHLKSEAIYPYHISTFTQAQKRIQRYIRFYNEKRAQLKLNKLTPVEYRCQLVA